MSHPLFEVVTTTAGAISIRNKLVNEIMHNPVGPWAEANALYIEQSSLREILALGGTEPLVLFDVGLGAAANALAVLACLDGVGENSRPLHMVSFERDMELLRFALDHAAQFEHFRGYEPALEAILEKGQWQSPKLHWELRVGDFLEEVDKEHARPHLIFFDPYSPKVNQEMWGSRCFRKIRALSRAAEESGTSLYTYSQATRIRVAMIEAGFFVGKGASTGLKEETTQASTDFKLLKSPLGAHWHSRWQKSHIRYPFDCMGRDSEQAVDAAVDEYMRRISQNGNFTP